MRFALSVSRRSPTFLKSFISSLKICLRVMGLTEAKDVLSSVRIQGAAKAAFLKKRRTLRRPALTAAMVLALEEMIISKNATPADRVCAGFFLICIYMRARFSDGLNMGEFFVDQPGGDSVGLEGYIEARVYTSRTSHNLQRKVDVLPMVCPLQGLSVGNWFSAWRAARREADVPEGPEVPLLPARGSILGWALHPPKAAQAAV